MRITPFVVTFTPFMSTLSYSATAVMTLSPLTVTMSGITGRSGSSSVQAAGSADAVSSAVTRTVSPVMDFAT